MRIKDCNDVENRRCWAVVHKRAPIKRLNVCDYPEMVKVGFEDHFVQVIYLCSTSEKENKSIWNVQTLTNAALYAAQAAHFKCIFETKIVFSAGVGWWLLPGASWWINSNLHLMVKSCDPTSFGQLFQNEMKTVIYFEEIWEIGNQFTLFFL